MEHIFLIISFTIFGSIMCVPDEKYTSKYDNIDLDEILHSDRLLNNYLNCILTGKSCTPDGAELKKNLWDGIETDCSKCTSKQKAGSKKVIIFLMKNKPDKWKEVEAKYDPQGSYKIRNKEELEKEGIAI